MIQLVIVLAVLASTVQGVSVSRRNSGQPKGAIYVNDCSGAPSPVNAPTPVNVIVPSCAVPPCIIRKGETYEVEVDFEYTNSNATENLNVVVRGIIGGAELPWNGVGPVGCRDLIVGSCPMKRNDYFTYGTKIAVLDSYPSTKLIIKWSMMDDDKKLIWCFTLPAEIK